MFSGIMDKTSQKVGGCSLQIKIVLASSIAVKRNLQSVLQIIGDHKFPFASDIPHIFIFHGFFR